MTTSNSTTDRKEKRRAMVARLKMQGKPAGHPKMGTKHVGPLGRRRVVIDRVHHQVTDLIVTLRDEQGRSWNAIAVEAEALAARLENRQPRRRWEMTSGWTRQKCILAYRRRKSGDDLPPQATHRRCRDCGNLLPVERFDGGHRICQTCEITGPLKRMELRRQRLIAAALLAIGRASERGCSPDELKEIAAMLIENGNGPSLAALDVEMFLAQLTRQCPGERQTFDAIYGLMHLMTLGETLGDTGKSVAAMSDAELERELHRELRREFADFFEVYDELVALGADIEDDDDR